jgi:hypothetical protein
VTSTGLAQGEEHPKRAARKRQQDTLGEQLPYQTSASCSKRQTYADFALPEARTRQQQVGHIDAGDEQHQRDHPHQEEQWPRKLYTQVVGASRSGQKHNVMGKEVSAVLLRPF